MSRRVWPPRRRGDSGTANIAAPKDSTTRAAKDGPVWFHCSAPAMRYEGKCGADSAHANHSENGRSMKGLKEGVACKSKPQSINSSTGYPHMLVTLACVGGGTALCVFVCCLNSISAALKLGKNSGSLQDRQALSGKHGLIE